MSHDHGHGHGHGDHSHLDPMDARVRALESILVEKGYVEREALDAIVDAYETRIGPRNGAHVVARAWTQPDFADWLRRDATAAIHSLGYTSRQGEHMVACFQSPAEHHMVVCTLCSCYPWSVLGLPPAWYKAPAYRARAVMEPRAVLAEFGCQVPEGAKVVVHDSTAETRYLVIPERPAGTQGWNAERLAGLVTRNSMIGTGHARAPGGA